jgi:hypothetical protein
VTIPDVNILLYVYDKALPNHEAYASWLTQTQTTVTIRAGNLVTSPHAWASCMTAPGRFQGTVVGSAAERGRLASRLGRARIQDAT